MVSSGDEPRGRDVGSGKMQFTADATRKGSMPMLSRRLMVDGASLVCRVESTMWPVRAAFTEISAVSKSRISPTMMMSGS